MVKSLILIAFWMFLIPVILGLGILKFDKKKNKNICLAIVLGLFVELLIFTMFAIPMTFLKCTFTLLKNSWSIAIIFLTLVSILINRKDLKETVNKNIDEIEALPKVLTVIFLLLLILQIYYPFKYMHEDYDDSNFVAKANIAIDTDTLFVYSDTGTEYTEFPIRQVFSQFPHYTATVASLSDIHSTVLAHTIFPVVFMVIVYSFYYVFGMTLFNKNQKKTMMFLIFLSIIYIFGDYSRYTPFVRLLYRVWQGKSLVANLSIPFIWYVFIEYIGKENSKFGWFIIFLSLTASITFSSMAFVLLPIAVMLLMIIYAIKDKKKKYLIGLFSIILLAIILISIYLSAGNLVVKNQTIENLTIKEKIEIFIEEVKSEENTYLVKESFERAGGGKYYFSIFSVCILLIVLKSKDENKDIILIFVIFSILILLINLNPIFSKLWSWTLGKEVHWRVYWLLPIGYTIAYVFTECVFSLESLLKKSAILAICICILIMNGKFVLTNSNYVEIGNYYKIPDSLLEVLFTIQSDNEEYKKVAGPEEVLVYTRQVDGSILIPQERNVNGFYSNQSIVKILESNDLEKIYNTVIRDKCNYLVTKKVFIDNKEELTDYGFDIMCENDIYVLYKIEI